METEKALETQYYIEGWTMDEAQSKKVISVLVNHRQSLIDLKAHRDFVNNGVK